MTLGSLCHRPSLHSAPLGGVRRAGKAFRLTCIRTAATAQRSQQQSVAVHQDAAAQPLNAATFLVRGYLLQQPRPQQQQPSSNALPAAACSALALAAALLALLPPDAAHAAVHGGDVHAQLAAGAANPSYDLAEGEDFWGNIARYGRYFVTVMLGTGYVMVRPLLGLFKNPVSGVLTVVSIAGVAYGVKLTLEAMLGISEPFEYLPAKEGF